jgi:hypothetical protein
MEYPYNEILDYTNDTEYRNALRKILKMEKYCSYENPEDIDAETLDKDDFDEISSSMMIDHIFESTSNIDSFQEIYKHSAGLMFSEDIIIGIVVLFSYDYLPEFHNCLCSHFKGELTSIDNAFIALLKQKIGLVYC